jgi:hypothetical protein
LQNQGQKPWEQPKNQLKQVAQEVVDPIRYSLAGLPAQKKE